jgi:hypothetical protein
MQNATAAGNVTEDTHELMFRDLGVEDSTVEITDNSITLTIQT